jgi:rhodanese-related sulfurtransferase
MSEVRRVSAEEAKELCEKEGYQYLDVRTEDEFAAGHVKGAHNIPFLVATSGPMKPNPDFSMIVCAVYAKDTLLCIGCKSGPRSLEAAKRMIADGFTNVVEQRGGFDGARGPFGQITEPGWSQKGFPVEKRTDGGSYVELKTKI